MMNNQLTALISIPEEAGYYFPNRHFQHICGRSLYMVMIDKLEAIPQIGKIIVNTDSSTIRNGYSSTGKVKAINVYQADPMEIELELTSDRLTTALLEHVEGEHFLQLGPIFPFLRHQTINYVIDSYDKHVLDEENRRHDSVFTIKTLNRRLYDSDKDLIREDRPNTFVEDGILHVFNRTTFLDGGNRKVGRKPYSCPIEDIENLAIDSEENYQLAMLIDQHSRRFPRVLS